MSRFLDKETVAKLDEFTTGLTKILVTMQLVVLIAIVAFICWGITR